MSGQSATANSHRRAPAAWMVFCGRHKRLLISATAPILLVVLFYAEENWRGERAWQTCRRELIARGQRFDPAAFNPPPLPDDQNFLKDPVVEYWLHPVSGMAMNPPLLLRPGDETLIGSWSEAKPANLKEWRDELRCAANYADSTRNARTNSPGTLDETVPVIVIDDVPLPWAIQNLARQAGLDFRFDPAVIDLANKALVESLPNLTVRFENVTARDALEAVLDNYSLRLDQSRGTTRALITRPLPAPASWPNTVDLEQEPLHHGADAEVYLIRIDDVPVLDALKNLARQAGINFQIDPRLCALTNLPSYSLELSNTTVRAALARTLRDNRLELLCSEPSGIYRIVASTGTPGPPGGRPALAVLQSFAPYTKELRALYAACARPRSRSDIDYQRYGRRGGGGVSLNFAGYHNLAHALSLRASALLALGDPDAAMLDVTVLHRVGLALADRADLFGSMIRVSNTKLYLQVIWEGLAGRRWNEAHLATLERQLQSIDLLATARNSVEGELVWWNVLVAEKPYAEEMEAVATQLVNSRNLMGARFALERLLELQMRHCPQGWMRQRQVWHVRMMEPQVARWDVAGQRVDLRDSASLPDIPWLLKPYMVLSGLSWQNFAGAAECTTCEQAGVNMARIACALERHRLNEDCFPATLAALTPRYFQKLPHDPFTGKSFKYLPRADHQFALYTPGWVPRREGAPDQPLRPDRTAHVWQYPSGDPGK